MGFKSGLWMGNKDSRRIAPKPLPHRLGCMSRVIVVRGEPSPMVLVSLKGQGHGCVHPSLNSDRPPRPCPEPFSVFGWTVFTSRRLPLFAGRVDREDFALRGESWVFDVRHAALAWKYPAGELQRNARASEQERRGAKRGDGNSTGLAGASATVRNGKPFTDAKASVPDVPKDPFDDFPPKKTI